MNKRKRLILFIVLIYITFNIPTAKAMEKYITIYNDNTSKVVSTLIEGEKMFLTINGKKEINPSDFGFDETFKIKIKSLLNEVIIYKDNTNEPEYEFKNTKLLLINIQKVGDKLKISLNDEKTNQTFYIRKTTSIFFKYQKYKEIKNAITLVKDIDDKSDISNLINTICAFDNYDGDLTSKIVINKDDYERNKNKIGTYQINLEVSDQSNNTSRLICNIQVVDKKAPVIDNPEVIRIGYLKKVDLIDNIKKLKINENYDQVDKLNISILKDGYKGNENKLGIYEVIYEVKDLSGNVGICKQQINVVDDVPPVVEGLKELTFSYIENVSIESILDKIKVYDELENEKVLIKVNKTNYKPNITGSYLIELSAFDKFNNETKFNIIIKIVDKIPPDFVLKTKAINTTVNNKINQEDIIRNVKQQIQFSYDDISLIKNEYESQYNKEGIYRVNLEARKNNEKIEISTNIIVDKDQSKKDKENINVAFKEDNSLLYISIGVGIIVIITISAIFFWAKRKRN